MPPELPDEYRWLELEPGPKMLVEALKLYGTLEAPGAADSPTILGWAAEVGLVDHYTRRYYRHDSTPWCGLFVALVALRAGKPLPPRQPLWALHWSAWGAPAPRPELGDVLVFSRPGGAHVAIYVGEDAECYHVIGGNQSNAVNIRRKERRELVAARRFYARGKPSNVRPVFLTSNGELSKDEA